MTLDDFDPTEPLRPQTGEAPSDYLRRVGRGFEHPQDARAYVFGTGDHTLVAHAPGNDWTWILFSRALKAAVTDESWWSATKYYAVPNQHLGEAAGFPAEFPKLLRQRAREEDPLPAGADLRLIFGPDWKLGSRD